MIPRMAATIDKASDQLFKDSIFMVIKFCSVKTPRQIPRGTYKVNHAVKVLLIFMWPTSGLEPEFTVDNPRGTHLPP